MNKNRITSEIEALNVYSYFIESDPNNTEAYFKRAMTKERLKDFQGAITDYNKVQLASTVDETSSLEPLEDKWRALKKDPQTLEESQILKGLINGSTALALKTMGKELGKKAYEKGKWSMGSKLRNRWRR